MTVLLTGATGLFGPYIAAALQARGCDTALAGLSAAAGDTHRADLTDEAQARALVDDVGPSMIIHAAALTNVDLCERDPALAERVNRGTTATLARLADEGGTRLVFISTDSVFDGTRGEYRESDEPRPLNVYARTKLEAESEVTRVGGLAVRMNFFGRNPRGAGLAEWLIRELGAGKEITGFADVVFSPLECSAAAELLVALAHTEAAGVLHLGAADAASKLAFALLVADAFGFERALVRPGRLSDGSLDAARPLNTSLVSDRAAGLLERALPTVADGVASLSRDAG